MTCALDAHWRIDRGPGSPDASGKALVTSRDDVRRLVDALSQPGVDDAYVTHLGRPLVTMPLLSNDPVPDHVLHLAVRGTWGYLAYAGAAAGHPTGSAATHGHYNTDYAAGSGLSLPQFEAAIAEFLATGELPTCIQWINEDAPGTHRTAS
jgi:hypothetical protein